MPVRLTGLAPVVSENTVILVLGSFPGRASLASGQYYAHPQNQFWRIQEALFEATPPPGKARAGAGLAAGALYRGRCQWLLERGVGVPGGDAGPRGMDGYRLDLMRRRPEFSAAMLSRLVRLYGTRADDVVGDARAMTDMGTPLGGGLTAREAFYLRDNEWASTPGDILWRRTKAGLHMSRHELDAASDWLAANL